MIKGLGSVLLAGLMAITPVTKMNTTKVNCYPVMGTVCSQEGDLVSVKIGNGNIFEFYSNPGDYKKGDICVMLIDNNGTKSIYDDVVIDAANAGRTK